MIVCEAVAMFPQTSVAVQVLTVVYEPAQAPFVVESAKVSVTAPPHPSVAVGVSNTGAPLEQLTVEGEGKAEITGATVSVTFMI